MRRVYAYGFPTPPILTLQVHEVGHSKWLCADQRLPRMEFKQAARVASTMRLLAERTSTRSCNLNDPDSK
jgi:hypothetical protein